VTEVYAAARTEQLDTLTGDRALLGASLWDAVGNLPTDEAPAGKGWLPRSATAVATRKRYATSFAALERSGILKASAVVSDSRAWIGEHSKPHGRAGL